MGGLRDSIPKPYKGSGDHVMTSLSRLEELLKDSGPEVLEVLQLICTMTKYGDRARLARDHIAPFVALGETSLDPEKYQSIRGRVEKDIDLLLSRQFISLEPELHCLLTTVDDSQLE